MAVRQGRASDRTRRAGAGLALAAALAALPATAPAADSLETAVKATYLYKFAPFVDWPADAFASPAAPFLICVVGKDPFGSVLDRAVAGQKAGARPFAVRRMAEADRSAGCQILYAGGDKAAVRQALEAVRGAPVLTVTDGSGAEGIVDFAIDRGRVLFRIDDEAAAQNRLTISSKLMSLALSVKPRHGGAP